MPQKHNNKATKKVASKESFLDKTKNFYIEEYRKLFAGLVLLSFLSVGVIALNYFSTGELIKRDVSLKGGLSLTLNTGKITQGELEHFLVQRFSQGSVNVRTIQSGGVMSGLIIEASDIPQEALIEAIREKVPLNKEDYSIEEMGSSLGESFFRQMFTALIVAFIGMGIVFQLYFKNIYATSAAIFSAFQDIFITFAIMTLLGVRLNAGGIAAYLMLIGYSIDTSILLSTKLLRDHPGDVRKGIFTAMKTGLTMSATGIAAIGISFLLTNNPTLKQIMLILLVGLVIDLLTTWVGNVSFLRFYLERKNVKT